MQTTGNLDDYYALDIETSGPSLDRDLVLQIGWARVVGGRVVSVESELLDWSSYLGTASEAYAALRQSLDKLDAQLADKGETLYTTLDRLEQEGLPPLDALGRCLDRLLELAFRNVTVAGYNAFRFDSPFLRAAFCRWLDFSPSPFEDNSLLDVGAMFLAMRTGTAPMPCETLREFHHRVLERHVSGVTWSLKTAAAWAGLPPFALHDAGDDARVCALVLEHFRQEGLKEGLHCPGFRLEQ